MHFSIIFWLHSILYSCNIKRCFIFIKHIFFSLANQCKKCDRTMIDDMGYKRPNAETFQKYISFFLNDLPGFECAKAGRPSYAAVNCKFNQLTLNLAEWEEKKTFLLFLFHLCFFLVSRRVYASKMIQPFHILWVIIRLLQRLMTSIQR